MGNHSWVAGDPSTEDRVAWGVDAPVGGFVVWECGRFPYPPDVRCHPHPECCQDDGCVRLPCFYGQCWSHRMVCAKVRAFSSCARSRGGKLPISCSTKVVFFGLQNMQSTSVDANRRSCHAPMQGLT